MSLILLFNYLQIVIYVIKVVLNRRSYTHFIGYWKHNGDASTKNHQYRD